MTTPDEIRDLTEKVSPAVRKLARVTPLEPMTHLSRPRRPVFAKREDLQVTGSFKLRGVAAKVSTLTAAQLECGLWAASTGNHGLAVAHVAQHAGVAAKVCVPAGAQPAKLARITAAGAEVIEVGGNAIEAERAARLAAADAGGVYVSPYNDPAVVAGQGTIGRELREQVGEPFTLVAAVGGGGLISGVAANLQGLLNGVVGTSPVVDAAMAASVVAGVIVAVDGDPTLSDGTAGDLEPGTITLELCRLLVNRWVLQPEERIAAALGDHRSAAGYEIEGSAAMALATAEDLDVVGPVVVIVCGGNV